MPWEILAITSIVAAAAAFLAWPFFRRRRSNQSSCPGCHGCHQPGRTDCPLYRDQFSPTKTDSKLNSSP